MPAETHPRMPPPSITSATLCPSVRSCGFDLLAGGWMLRGPAQTWGLQFCTVCAGTGLADAGKGTRPASPPILEDLEDWMVRVRLAVGDRALYAELLERDPGSQQLVQLVLTCCTELPMPLPLLRRRSILLMTDSSQRQPHCPRSSPQTRRRSPNTPRRWKLRTLTHSDSVPGRREHGAHGRSGREGDQGARGCREDA